MRSGVAGHDRDGRRLTGRCRRKQADRFSLPQIAEMK
jgi:hypothetical protein